MVQYSSSLAQSLFPFLQEEDARVMFGLMDELVCREGTVLFSRNDPAEAVYFLIDGKIAVQKKTGFGERVQVVALLMAGAPIGERGLLDGKKRGATLLAVEESRLLVLKKKSFEQFTKSNPVPAVHVLSWILDRVTLRLQKNSERLAHVL